MHELALQRVLFALQMSQAKSSERQIKNWDNQNQVFKTILTPNQTRRFIYRLPQKDCQASGFFSPQSTQAVLVTETRFFS